MADKQDIKTLLQKSASYQRKIVTNAQLEAAANELLLLEHITKSDLEKIGRINASDPAIFAATDIEDINNVLDTIKKRKP